MIFNCDDYDWSDTTRFVPMKVNIKKPRKKRTKQTTKKKMEEMFAKRLYIKRNIDWKRDGKKYHKQYNNEHYKTVVQKKELTKLTNELFSEHND